MQNKDHARRLMLSEKSRETLKSMYSLVGSHSAVKLCRWQKSMMRGRGGCYKWTMYGIQSHRCIEATPNLSCANNCIFCWRHNTNPTASEWRWEVQDPETIFDGWLASHRQLVKGIQGMPGVTEESLEEALNPKHCALSLVGEPIKYPYINELIRIIHKHSISSFLVTNGQFPDEIAALGPVTQLYLSVDAPNREVMKILDRPILCDYWERFIQSVDNMKKKKGRTVFRLTLMDGFNMATEHIAQYGELFERGKPHFIELKRLTPAFSGKTRTILRIRNVPSWEKMKCFAEKLCHTVTKGVTYFLASLHEHSGCILLAQKSFLINGQIHTWINFEKFNEMITSSSQHNSILPEDYLLPTPFWALPESPLTGFDPAQQRHLSTKRRQYMEKIE